MKPAYDFNSSASSFCFPDLNEDHIPYNEQYGSTTTHPVLLHTHASSACPAFFNLAQDYQSKSHLVDYPQTSQKVDKKIVLIEGSCSGHVFSASSDQQTDEDNTKDLLKMIGHVNRSTSTKDERSITWMSSEMRAMRKISPPNNSSETEQINSADHCNSSTVVVVRVCSDCNTTKTPLWRGGPQGPKSLCNACGIRRRKARKAIALEAQNDIEIVHKINHYSSTGPSDNHREKKLRTRYHDVTNSHDQTTSKSKISFEDFAYRKSTKLFPQDEAEAAILLMSLSCGLICR